VLNRRWFNVYLTSFHLGAHGPSVETTITRQERNRNRPKKWCGPLKEIRITPAGYSSFPSGSLHPSTYLSASYRIPFPIRSLNFSLLNQSEQIGHRCSTLLNHDSWTPVWIRWGRPFFGRYSFCHFKKIWISSGNQTEVKQRPYLKALESTPSKSLDSVTFTFLWRQAHLCWDQSDRFRKGKMDFLPEKLPKLLSWSPSSLIRNRRIKSFIAMSFE